MAVVRGNNRDMVYTRSRILCRFGTVAREIVETLPRVYGWKIFENELVMRWMLFGHGVCKEFWFNG